LTVKTTLVASSEKEMASIARAIVSNVRLFLPPTVRGNPKLNSSIQ